MVQVEFYIPTRGRRHRQVTLDELDTTKAKFWVVHREGERPYNLPDEVESLVCLEEGLSVKRDFIYQHAAARDVICVQIDDDCRLYKRTDGPGSYLEKVTDVTELVAVIQQAVADGYFHGGLSQRTGNNREPEYARENGKIVCFMWHYMVDVFFGETPVMADYNVTLDLLTRGYKNLIFYEWCCNQSSGDEGGCAFYRTKQVVEDTAHFLAEKYPEVCRTDVKFSTGKGIFGGKRTDVRVQWKKAWRNLSSS